MNDTANLSEMIKENTDQPQVFEESNLDLPVEETPTEEVIEETPIEVESIGIVPLNDWFEANSGTFDNISQVKVAIRGIDSATTLIMAVLDGQGEVEGNPSRDLQVFKNANIQPVLGIPASEMQIFNGLKIVYPYTDIVIKCYGIRTGLICVFCNIVDDLHIPYQVVKVKKKDVIVEVPRRPAEEVTAKMSLTADLEALQILYKQSSKAIDELSTIESVVKWLLEKQKEIRDINHLLQIDNVIINILS